MATALKNLSSYNSEEMPDASNVAIGIVVSEWNSEVTGPLLDGALNTLVKHGVNPENIWVENVPGTFELPLGAKYFAEDGDVDAVICIGCVIQGETPHFDFVCDAAANGIMRVGLDYGIPVIFGVLTTLTQEQALDRAGGKHGNKGIEAAVTALRMIRLGDELAS
ncbi:MAG: 6,7-dimethyl-8-ribityllumazine synthase [Bacteroidia bacterium]|nr:6,7-dimethyl-8-ribityllumazine synthase [Bacteroidia bacterium]